MGTKLTVAKRKQTKCVPKKNEWRVGQVGTYLTVAQWEQKPSAQRAHCLRQGRQMCRPQWKHGAVGRASVVLQLRTQEAEEGGYGAYPGRRE